MDTTAPRPLITSRQLMTWLGVSKQWLKDRLADPDFPRIDLAPEGAPRRTLRFDVEHVAAYLKMPAPPRETSNRTAA
jgi:hypothetical protein